MICLKCDNENFATAEAEVKQEFKGEALVVKSPVMVCQSCGWSTVGNDQIDELRKRTADVYRVKHGLLTSGEIKERRLALNMTQRQFADFLRAGEASVKRWETWQVQDASSDELIRVKCKQAQLEGNLLQEKTYYSWSFQSQDLNFFAQSIPTVTHVHIVQLAEIVSPIGERLAHQVFADSQNGADDSGRSNVPAGIGHSTPSGPSPPECDASRRLLSNALQASRVHRKVRSQ